MEDAASSAPESGPGTEEGREDGKRFMWTSLEVDAALQKEGLFGLEVLREDDVLPVAKKAKKKEKKPKKARKTAEEQPETDAAEELTDEQVEGATSKWDALLFGEWTMPIGVRRSLHSAGMVAPTVIQSLAFKPSLTAGVNLVACAETGSGKTLAFALPIALALLKVQRPEGDERPVLCLAVLPTRELALQVKDTIAMLFKGTPMSAFALIGGIAIQKQERVLKHRPEVLVATPGRLWDTMQKLDIKFDLRYLVLDEADRLVGDKAFREMGAIISKVKNVHTQRFIYSATILNRKNDLKMLFKLLAVKNPTVCVASHKGNLVLPYDQLLQTKSFNIKDTEEASNATLPEKLEFKVVKCFDNEKELKLVAYLMEHYSGIDRGRTIVFVNSISYAYRLEPLLSLILWRDKHELRLAKSHCLTLDKESKVNYITSLHSKLKQKQRLKRLEQFNKHDKAVMICTDVAARGIDLPNVDEVVHFQAPRTASLFIHRSGRTARFAAKGAAICICESSEVEAWEGLFKAVNRNLDDVEEVLSFIPQKQYQKYKKLLTLASAIEAQEHRLSKESKTESWLHTAAKQADIALSDEEEESEAKSRRSKTYRSLKAGKRALLNLRSNINE